MTLTVTVPEFRAAEHEYALQFLLGGALGLECRFKQDDCRSVLIEAGDKRIEIPSIFLLTPEGEWETLESLPSLPLEVWDTSAVPLKFDLVEDQIPILFGAPATEEGATTRFYADRWLSWGETRSRLSLDIVGSCFFLLAQYEESVIGVRDRAGRFPVEESLPMRGGFLRRPILDEYAAVLASILIRMWPGMVVKRPGYENVVTHDVDHPLSTLETPSFLRLGRRMAGKLVNGGGIRDAASFVGPWLSYRRGNRDDLSRDPYNTFDWLMSESESAGYKAKFYLMSESRAEPFGGNYELDHPAIAPLIRSIHDRGHELGFHPTGDSYASLDSFRRQARKLRRFLRSLGVSEDIELGGRQHWLRWDRLRTPRNWNDAGFSYDSTLGFSGQPGFRCGTCYPFRLWDSEDRQALNVYELPLVVMWTSLTSKAAMGLASEGALRVASDLQRACQVVSGRFVHLWHNDELRLEENKRCFSTLLSG